MSVFFYGSALFITALFIHISIWKIYLPRNQTKILLYLFSAILLNGIFLLWKLSSKIGFLGISAPQTIWEYLQLSFFFISLSVFYITTYSALEVDSPSLTMIMNIAAAGTKGIDKTALEQKINDDILIAPRVRDLVRGEMISLDAGVYKLKPKGAFVVSIFIAYRRLLRRLQKGG